MTSSYPTDSGRPRVQGRLAGRLFALLAAIAMVASACGGESAAFQGVVIEPAPSVESIVIPKSAGNPTSVVPSSGNVQLVYFGYTRCPDVCPTTLATLKRVYKELGDKRSNRIGLTMFTIDPDRDRPADLRQYLDFFNTKYVPAVVDDPKALRAIADAFGADYSVTKKANGDVEVAHTGGLYAVDDTGHVAVQWPFDADESASKVIAHDLKLVLAKS